MASFWDKAGWCEVACNRIDVTSDELRIMLAQHLVQRVGLANDGVQPDLDPEAPDIVYLGVNDLFGQPSSRRQSLTRRNFPQSLAKLAQEDPSFKVSINEETGQTLISGMGELHLEIIVDRPTREFKVGANVGKPQVAYRETIRTASKAEGKFVRQSGGRGQYGQVYLELEPLEPGKGFEFVSKVVGGTVPREYWNAVEKGIKEAADGGVLTGYPFVDFRATLTDGSYHEVDSSEMAFKIAGSMGFKECAKKAKPVILEPIMNVEVVTPEDYMGDVIGDLNSRRGKIQNMEKRGNAQVIRAQVPLSEMFGYATDLRSRTQGRATYTMQFSNYDEVPKGIAEGIIAKVKGE